MKKLLYCLTVVVLGLTSCNTWDDEETQNYGNGPAVSIDLTTTTDSTFTFTVNPAGETLYYSYAVTEGSEAQEISSSSLLKNTVGGTVSGAILKYADNASVTVDMRDAKKQPLCQPNTSYVIYAVAANDKGVTGEIASLVVKTTDGNVPVVTGDVSTDDVVTVTFSENVAEGTGTVSARYYKEWDITNPVDISSEDISVAVAGNTVAFAVQGVPAGAYVSYSWTEGAFVDSFGNKCPAMNSGLNMTTGKFTGINIHLANVSWNIEDKEIMPKAGSLVDDYKAFTGTITFDNAVYRNDDAVKTGDISVVYTNSKKTSTVGLTLEEWAVSGNVVTFSLPEAPSAGDVITVKIKEDVIFDVCGNGNNEYVSTDKTVWWKYFAMTKEMVLGSFHFTYESAYDEEPVIYDGETIVITENPDEENGLLFKDLYLKGSEVPGRYDINTGKIYIYAYYELGIVPGQSGNYGLITYSISGADEIEFTVNADGTIVSDDLGIVACDENYEEALGWYDKFSTATFTPVSSSAKMLSVKKVHASLKSRKANVNTGRLTLGRIRR